jgi:PKD repeat protein
VSLRSILVLSIVVAAIPAAAQHSCTEPVVLDVLTGETLAVSATGSEGNPTDFRWYITPPGAGPPSSPSSTASEIEVTADLPGLWSIALIADYPHQALGGGPYRAETCVAVVATSVVADLTVSADHIATDESLIASGAGSVWAVGVAPEVEWQVDGLPLTACNGGPPPSSPAELICTVEGDWFDVGWHTLGLLLTDPVTEQSSLATVDFEIIEVIPLSVELSWSPVNPDPGELVLFNASVTPVIPESEFTLVEWDLGDGTIITYTSCPQPWASCLDWAHPSYPDDGWYDVSVTVETADESAFAAGTIEVGDPIPLPTAAFSVTPAAPTVQESVTLAFQGSCEGTCSYDWSFGDGSQSTAQNPVHVWTVPDSYTVSLTVTNDSGADTTSTGVTVGTCWAPATPTQSGSCAGGPVLLTASAGSSWVWSTGATSQTTSATIPGAYWVNIDDGSGCWGHAAATVVLDNCGNPDGDANLDGVVDTADVSALVPELTDGDGDAVSSAGGGDLTAPGGDVTRDGWIRVDDLLTVLLRVFD